MKTNCILKNIVMSFLLMLLLTCESFSMMRTEEVLQEVKPLPTTAPKNKFWTQGSDGCAVLKKKMAFVIPQQLEESAIKRDKPINVRGGSLSTQDDSDIALDNLLNVDRSQQKEVLKQFVANEVEKKLKESEQAMQQKDIDRIKLFLSKDNDFSKIAEIFGVDEEFVKALQ